MASSTPIIEDVSVPSPVPPNNQNNAELTIRQSGEDPWFSDGSCTAGGGFLGTPNFTGWKTPVKVYVDGELVHEDTYCIPNTESRTVQVPFSVPEGKHPVTIEVYSLGGNAYVPGDVERTVNDDYTVTVEGSAEAADPSKPTGLESIMNTITDITSGLNVSLKWAAILSVGVVGVLLLA